MLSKKVASYRARNNHLTTVIDVYLDPESNHYADSDELGMGHKHSAAIYSPWRVAAELARRHGYVLVDQAGGVS